MKILSFDVGIYNLAFANIDLDLDLDKNVDKSLQIKIKDWGILCLKDKDKDTKKIDLNAITKTLISVLYERFSEQTFDIVLIENQPCMKNPTMKSIQMIVYTFFMMQSHLEGREIDVKFVSASNKLKVKHKCDVSAIVANTKNKYTVNKKVVVEYARNYLNLTNTGIGQGNGHWINLFEKEKKKDDWADALCQAIHYIENHL